MTTRDAGNGGASGQGSSPQRSVRGDRHSSDPRQDPAPARLPGASIEANHGASAYIGDCPVLVELIKNDSRRREIVTGP